MVNELFIQGKATHKHVYGLPQIHVQSLFLIPVQNFLQGTLIRTLGNSVLLRPVTSYRTSSRVRPCARWEIVSCYIIRNFLYNRHTAVMVMPHSSNSGPRSHTYTIHNTQYAYAYAIHICLMHTHYAYALCICITHTHYAYKILCNMPMQYAYAICLCNMPMQYAYTI